MSVFLARFGFRSYKCAKEHEQCLRNAKIIVMSQAVNKVSDEPQSFPLSFSYSPEMRSYPETDVARPCTGHTVVSLRLLFPVQFVLTAHSSDVDDEVPGALFVPTL